MLLRRVSNPIRESQNIKGNVTIDGALTGFKPYKGKSK